MLQKILQPGNSDPGDTKEEESLSGQENVPCKPQEQICLPSLPLCSPAASSGQQHRVRGEGEQSPRSGE